MFPDLTRDDLFRIETPRLWLRWPAVADAVAIARIVGDKEVAEMTSNVPHPYPDGAAETFIFEARKHNALGQSLKLGLAAKRAPDEIVGLIETSLSKDGAYDLGYVLAQDLWGEGLMTEAVQALIDTLFTLRDAREIATGVRVMNPASRRVLEKAGFQMVGSGLGNCPARGGRLPLDHFRLGRRTWSALKGWRTPSVERISIDAGINALQAAIAAKALDKRAFGMSSI